MAISATLPKGKNPPGIYDLFNKHSLSYHGATTVWISRFLQILFLHISKQRQVFRLPAFPEFVRRIFRETNSLYRLLARLNELWIVRWVAACFQMRFIWEGITKNPLEEINRTKRDFCDTTRVLASSRTQYLEVLPCVLSLYTFQCSSVFCVLQIYVTFSWLRLLVVPKLHPSRVTQVGSTTSFFSVAQCDIKDVPVASSLSNMDDIISCPSLKFVQRSV